MLHLLREFSNGNWVRNELLKFPSWNENGSMEIVNLLGDGKEFIKVIHDGDEGTLLQNVITIVGWHDGKFIPVFMETLVFDLNEAVIDVHYKLDLKFQSIGTKQVVALLHEKKQSLIYNFKEAGKDKNINEEWSEQLPWNEQSFSFYDAQKEYEKLKMAKFKYQTKFEKTRIKFLKNRPDVYKLDYPVLDKLGIML